jgi:Tfp pilus assembly protein FimT
MELLVVMGIFAVISSIVLVNHSKFNSSVLLGNLAYSVAVSIREAQVYGVSVQQFNNEFRSGYGVHFNAAEPTSYIFFADRNANNRFDEEEDSIIRSYTLNKQHRILRFCGVRSTGEEDCSDSEGSGDIAVMDVVFIRPDPDANITSDKEILYSSAKVTVASTAGETRSLSVASTGQIAVSPTGGEAQ